jgi:hypothetical protein
VELAPGEPHWPKIDPAEAKKMDSPRELLTGLRRIFTRVCGLAT